MATSILTRELDERLRSVEIKLAELTERMTRFEVLMQPERPVEPVDATSPTRNGNRTSNGHNPAAGSSAGDGKVAELEAHIMRLDDRIQKIASSIVAQASRV